MSGICGFVDIANKYDQSKKKQIIQRMSETLKHRGLDDEIYYVKNNIALGFRKLITNSKENKNVVFEKNNSKIICLIDGCFYNTHELYNKLFKQQHPSIQLSDASLAANLYKLYQEDFINHLDGEFSLIIWDEQEQKLILSKDQFGSKPLFYYYDRQVLIFASEIKAILSSNITH